MMEDSQSHLQEKSLEEWLFYLESIHTVEIDLGLTRISRVAELLAIDLSFAKVVTVAGTNGKGTTCAFLENALLSLGHNVAVYSSPHIERFNERLRINKVDIDDDAIVNAFMLIERTRGDVSLTYYEYTTLAALLVMMAKRPDFIILEVGLGGRLDATNIIDANVAVITTVDLDHQAFLGNDRESIGVEKAGIFRPEGVAVIGDIQPPKSVIAHGNKLKTLMHIRQYDFHVTMHNQTNKWQWSNNELTYTQLPLPHIPLDNVATALQVLSLLRCPLTDTQVRQLINSTKVIGRTEMISGQQCNVMLDVGHNPLAARYLAKVIAEQSYTKVHAVFSMLADKDILSTVKPLLPHIETWNIATLDSPRAVAVENIVASMQPLGVTMNCFDNIEDAYRMTIHHAGKNDLVLVFGSFFTVSAIRKLLV